MEAAVITTYRCDNRCLMCNIWRHPTKIEEEFSPALLEKLPDLRFCNITGGEPFLREDLVDIAHILRKKARRVVISTNGYATDRIIDLVEKVKGIGIRISLEGLPAANDELRGRRDCFDHGLRTLLELKQRGIKDIGFAVTVSDRNAGDMIELYHLARYLNVEFATAVTHNSYYFHKADNRIQDKDKAIAAFEILIRELLATWRIKNWFRAYFKQGLINRIRGGSRLLPCRAGTDLFFLDPFGEIRPCNGMEPDTWLESMGNLHKASFEEIWSSEKARQIRELVDTCPQKCWMVGTASPAMKKAPWRPALWVVRNKWKSLLGNKS